jgi:cell division transport system permease protein
MARRAELLPDRDGAARFLPWTIAVMVYLAALAIAGALALDGAMRRFDRGLTGAITVQLPGGDVPALASALQVIRDTPGVLDARPLDDKELQRLVEPWLGRGALPSGVVLPALIDVRIDPQARPNLNGLANRLANAVPGAQLDDHQSWVSRLRFLGRAGQWIAVVVVLAVTLATVAIVIVTTRAGLAQHQGVIEVLHLVGARDRWIAARVQGHALSLALRGGLLGLALAALTLFALWRLGEGVFGALLPTVSLAPAQWGMLIGLAPVGALIAMLTARLTVLGALARQP